MTTYGGEQRPQGLSSTLPRQYEVPGDEHRDRHAGCQRDEDAAERVARRQVSSTALLVFCARVERSVLVVRRPPRADWRDPLRKAQPYCRDAGPVAGGADGRSGRGFNERKRVTGGKR